MNHFVLLNTIFNDMLGWDKNFYAFNRPIYDQIPYHDVYNEDDKSVLIFNCVGMSKEDITVEVIKEGQTNYLSINGERKNEYLDKPFDLRARFSIDMEKVEKIQYKVENGLLYITLIHKQPEKSNIKIEYKN